MHCGASRLTQALGAMPVNVSLSEEARIRLLNLCGAEHGNQPLALLTWRESTAELRRVPSGASIMERISGAGSVQIVPGGGEVPAKSIIYF